MKTQATVMIRAGLLAMGCGQKATEKKAQAAPEAQAAHQSMPAGAVHQDAEMPQDEIHGQAMAEGGMHGAMGVNTEVHLDPAVQAAWRGVRLEVVDKKSGSKQVVDVPLGTATALAGSGLTATVDTFIPDFVMGADGIGTRSPEPNNPAAHVVIVENGETVFDGWLFARMREIHPFVHDAFQVFLAEGIPAGPKA